MIMWGQISTIKAPVGVMHPVLDISLGKHDQPAWNTPCCSTYTNTYVNAVCWM